MKYSARLLRSVCVTTSVVFCLAPLLYSTTHSVTRVHAALTSITASVSSSPSSGPVGATISVSGSGWSDEPDGEQVSLGYMIAAFCSTVPDYQASTFKSGSFSGSLHFPTGTPLGTYSICATFGSTTAIANDFIVLTESSPKISISLPMQPGKQQATVSGSNYLPSGTSVNLYWESTNGNVLFAMTPAVSNSSGLISRTFLIPTSIASGSYKIMATVSGQPTLNSSATFTYNAPIPTPTPTPSPTALPASDPTPTKNVSPTAVATAAISTPTTSATSLVGSQNTTTGQTPSSGTTTSIASDTNQLTSIVLIGSITGVLAILAIILIVVLFFRRKKARSQQIAAAVGSTQNSQMSWQNSQSGNMPYPINNGSMAASPQWPSASSPPSQQLQISPYTHLLQQAEGGSSVLTNESTQMTPDNPDIESIKRQVQMGLFVTSANHRDD